MQTSDASSRAAPAASILTVDLDMIAANYRMLSDKVAPAVCACVVKADAYGLGLEPVARRLWREGCRVFFVASLEEGIGLRGILAEAEIIPLNGLLPGEEPHYREYRLFPTLNDLGQLAHWSAYCASHGNTPAVLHVDTGMSRLSLSAIERTRLLETP